MSGRVHGWKVGLGTALLSARVLTVACAATSLSSLVPASDAVPGWEALSADKGSASPDELWKIYNGGDGEWKTAGVTSAFQRYYKHKESGRVLTLVINKTGADWQKAKALYAKKNEGFTEQNGYQTVQVKAAGSLGTPAQGLSAHFWGKYYYCTIQINGTSTQDVSAAKAFMTKLSATITEKG